MVGDVEGLSRCWDFNPSTISAAVVAARFKSVLLGLRPAPPRVVLKSVGRRSRWNVFFCYLPNGELSAAHRFTLKRLGTLRGGVLAICAAPSVDHVPRELIDRCESVCWKGLSGFDFSAFAIALELLAEKSPGCDVFVMNDSVLGPFADVDAMVETGQWRLTGFTASSAFENHLQSYAWFLRDLTPDIPRKLISVMSSAYSFNSFQHVVNCQETRFARVASRFGSVGSLWFGNHASVGDPSLYRALPLLDGGFPFLKRSLLGGKLKHLHPQRELEQRLALLGHPPVISVVSDAR